MTMAMLDVAVKVPVGEATMTGAPTVDHEAGEGGQFGDLLRQLIGEGAEGQNSSDAEGCPCEGEAEATGNATLHALALPVPLLQAALASAMSSLNVARAGATDAAKNVEGDVLNLSRLVVRAAAEANVDGGNAAAVDGMALPGDKPMLSAWLNGPYAAAALATGAADRRPMNLAVLGVATHFAPVMTANETGAAVDAKATIAEMLPVDAVPTPLEPEAGPAKFDSNGTVATASAIAMSTGNGNAMAGGNEDTGAGQRDAEQAASRIEAGAPSDVPELAVPGETVTPAAPSAARQIGDEVTRALSGAAPRTTPTASQDARPSHGKLRVLHIQLQPESLGTVTVRMEIKGDALELRIDAARADTAEIIQRDREMLSSLIRAAGYSAEDTSIKVSYGDPTMAVSTTASTSDTQAGTSGHGSHGAGERWAQGREGGGRRGEPPRDTGQGSGQEGGAARQGEQDVYL